VDSTALKSTSRPSSACNASTTSGLQNVVHAPGKVSFPYGGCKSKTDGQPTVSSLNSVLNRTARFAIPVDDSWTCSLLSSETLCHQIDDSHDLRWLRLRPAITISQVYEALGFAISGTKTVERRHGDVHAGDLCCRRLGNGITAPFSPLQTRRYAWFP